MRRIALMLALAIGCCSAYAAADSTLAQPLIKKKVQLFPLTDVRVTGGQFKHIMDLDHQYLLSLEPDRLLSWFRREAGLTPKAQPYPGWESETAPNRSPLSGHMMGFYLSSMAMMYASTGDEKILDKLEYTLAGLDECQRAFGDGYLLPTLNGRHIFEDVAEGKFKTSNPFITSTASDANYDYWEPVYVLNKIMLGLNRVYLDCHLPMAKKLLVNTADWFGGSIISKLSHAQMQKLLFCEHGSINESFINVYQLTHNKKYLDWAQQLNDEDMWLPAAQGKDILNGWHANTQIPKFTGFENNFDYTGNAKMTAAARFFWNAVVDNRSWVIGGNSTGEHFFPKADFDARVVETGGPESCNSVNMMRLTEALYQDYAEPAKVDYYERVLYNHILANYNPDNGMCVYYTSMRPGHYKVYSSLYDSFWCCTGTGLEAPAKFAQMTYAHDDSHLYINLFMPSELTWAEKGLKLSQQTRFPDEERSEITLSLQSAAAFNLAIRQPGWLASAQPEIRVNGKALKTVIKNGYAEINRVWKNGDRISIGLKGKFAIEPLSSSNKYLAFLHGPIVLAAKVDNHGLKKADFTQVQNGHAGRDISISDAPALGGSLEQLRKNVHRVSGDELKYTVTGIDGKSIELIPFNQIAFSRYAVYFPHFDNVDTYKTQFTHQQKTDDLKQQLDKQTVDRVQIGDRASEQQHGFESVFSNSGGGGDSRWRDANHGGYFMYRLKTTSGKPIKLYTVYSGNDEGARVFDIEVNGKLLQTVDHTHKIASANGGLYPLIISIPAEMTQGKDSITVKFQAKRNNTAGGLFDVRILE